MKRGKPNATQPAQSAERAYHVEKHDLGGTDRQVLARLWSYARPYRGRLLLSLLMLPAISALSLVQPHILQLAIDGNLTPGRIDGLGLLALLFLACVVGQLLLEAGQYLLMQWVGLRALAELRNKTFRHLQGLQLRFFHKNPVGRLMTRLTTDVDTLSEAIAGGMITIVADILTLAAIVVILLVKSWQLALITFLCVPLLFGLSAVFRALMRKAFQIIRVKVARLNAYLQEAVTGMALIQLFNRQKRSSAEFEIINREHRDAQFSQIRWDATLFAVVEAISSIAVALIIWYGSGQALEGAVTLGVLVAFIEYVRKFFVPIRDLSQKYALFQSAITSAERIFALLDEKDALPRAEHPVVPEGRHHIEVKNVWFAYEGERWVLKDVSFTIEPGQRLALVGRTGSGKSTLIGLLTRMYDPQKGQILIDGVDIREWDRTALRRLFAVVLQDPFLFSGELLDNITLREPRISAAAAEKAADAVHLTELLQRKGGSLALKVVERGANLSTGQKQLVAFARALARDPQVLILDEATSNVDSETESLIQDAVRVLLAGRTSLVIAHRLSTIRTVDRILVLHHGEVVEEGTHEELIARSGLYAKLYELEYELAA